MGGRTPHSPLAVRICIGVLLMLSCISMVWAQSATPSISEYQLKAVFLFRFSQFVEWPPESFATPTAPLVIGVLGDDPFGSHLDDAVRDEKVNGHPVVVERYRHVDELSDCHVLFVSSSPLGQLGPVLARTRGRSVLTVGETEGFAGNGGMIRLLTVNNRIRLRVNATAVQTARLSISSKLLRSADVINGAP